MHLTSFFYYSIFPAVDWFLCHETYPIPKIIGYHNPLKFDQRTRQLYSHRVQLAGKSLSNFRVHIRLSSLNTKEQLVSSYIVVFYQLYCTVLYCVCPNMGCSFSYPMVQAKCTLWIYMRCLLFSERGKFMQHRTVNLIKTKTLNQALSDTIWVDSITFPCRIIFGKLPVISTTVDGSATLTPASTTKSRPWNQKEQLP